MLANSKMLTNSKKFNYFIQICRLQNNKLIMMRFGIIYKLNK